MRLPPPLAGWVNQALAAVLAWWGGGAAIVVAAVAVWRMLRFSDVQPLCSGIV